MDSSVTPMVSVAMITYNHKAYVGRAIESILSQQVNFPIEVVVGEDCSTDGTREVVLAMTRKSPDRVRVIMSDQNVGAHKNAQRTERQCNGKYVAFCEGDDFWHDPTKLSKQVAFFEQHPDYSLLHSHCDRLYVSTGRLLKNDLQVPKDLVDSNGYEDILTGKRYTLSVTVMARRNHLNWVLDNCPECTDPKWPMGDTQRWLELSRLGNVGCIHESLATTCFLPESASQSRDVRKRLRFFLAARELKLHYLNKYPVNAETDKAVRQKLALSLLRYAYFALDSTIADQMFEDYVGFGGPSVARARYLRWGSRSRLRQRFVLPLVKLQSKWAKRESIGRTTSDA